MTCPANSHSGGWLQYQLVSKLVHMPGLMRLVACVLRRYPSLGRFGPVAAQHSAVTAVFRRQTSFSNTAHAPNLVAGAFAIGMENGPRHDNERSFLERVLPSPDDFGRASGDESQRRIALIQEKPGGTFDLVQDYMVWVAWSALRQTLGAPAPAIEAGQGQAGTVATDATIKPLFAALRTLGAHLIIGSVAPRSVLERAHQCAAALHGRIDPQDVALQRAWAALTPPSHGAVLRNAVGLTWVGHPATVQAGALMMQELLGRPVLYAALRKQAADAQSQRDALASLRSCLRDHILELLRFRPVFPLLVRDVPRDTGFSASPDTTCAVTAGAKLTVFALSAMFDAQALHAPSHYSERRATLHGIDPREHNLVFGHGPRACIAKDQVLEILVSALTDLLLLPPLRFADPWFARMRYDGPVISRMRLTFALH